MTSAIKEYVTLSPAFRPHDPQAPVVAREVMGMIGAQDSRLQIEHVGSSAVPGCGGKGYIDLLVMYPDGLLDVAKEVLEYLGFQPQQSRDPFPEERPMRVGSVEHAGRLYPIHAHVVAADSPEVCDLLWFREQLCSDAVLRQEYEAEKKRVLAAGVADGRDYTEKKSHFIQRVLALRNAPRWEDAD